MKPLVTATDVSAARKAGQTSISIPADAIVTPQAADDARDYGIALMRGGAARGLVPAPPAKGAVPGMAPTRGPVAGAGSGAGVSAAPGNDALAQEVRRQVAARLGPGVDPAKLDAAIRAALGASSSGPGTDDGAFVRRAGGVAHVRQNALPQGVAAGKTVPGGAVRMVEALAPSASSPGVTYMNWENSTFDWTFTHTEVLVVLSGELTLTREGTAFAASGGDALHIAAGSAVTLAAKGKVTCALSSWPVSKP